MFINHILFGLGYKTDNLRNDDYQKTGKSRSTAPDIRAYGKNEKHNKHSMARLVIETKAYNTLKRNINEINWKQLKNYVEKNQNKIKFICVTDFISLFVFNVEKIIIQGNIDFTKPDEINAEEISQFKNNLQFSLNFEEVESNSLIELDSLSQKNLFEKYDFPNPAKHKEKFNIKHESVCREFVEGVNNIIGKIYEFLLPPFEKACLKFFEIILVLRQQCSVTFKKLYFCN